MTLTMPAWEQALKTMGPSPEQVKADSQLRSTRRRCRLQSATGWTQLPANNRQQGRTFHFHSQVPLIHDQQVFLPDAVSLQQHTGLSRIQLHAKIGKVWSGP